MDTTCHEYELLVEILADGELDDNQSELVRGHMACCSVCAAYHAELLALNRRIQRVARDACGPDLSGTVVGVIRRRLRLRFAVVALGLLTLRLLDLLGCFGGGLTPRVVVMVGAMLAFMFLGFNPLRLVRSADSSNSHSTTEGEPNASS